MLQRRIVTALRQAHLPPGGTVGELRPAVGIGDIAADLAARRAARGTRARSQRPCGRAVTPDAHHQQVDVGAAAPGQHGLDRIRDEAQRPVQPDHRLHRIGALGPDARRIIADLEAERGRAGIDAPVLAKVHSRSIRPAHILKNHLEDRAGRQRHPFTIGGSARQSAIIGHRGQREDRSEPRTAEYPNHPL